MLKKYLVVADLFDRSVAQEIKAENRVEAVRCFFNTQIGYGIEDHFGNIISHGCRFYMEYEDMSFLKVYEIEEDPLIWDHKGQAEMFLETKEEMERRFKEDEVIKRAKEILQSRKENA